MYDLLDRPVDDLPVFERAVLGAMRRWVHALTLAGTVPAAEGKGAFDAAMRALDAGSSDELLIHRPCHSTVGEVEAVILGMWRLVRADRLGPARAAAERLLTIDHAGHLVTAMARVSALGHP